MWRDKETKLFNAHFAKFSNNIRDMFNTPQQLNSESIKSKLEAIMKKRHYVSIRPIYTYRK